MSRTADDFLADIAARPDDDSLKAVFADWLLERADPRGELIALQLKGVRTDEDLSREALLLRSHLKQWLPDEVLINVVPSSIVFEKGMFAAARVVVRSPSAMLASLGHPVWATVRRLASAPVELIERCPLLDELTHLDEQAVRRLAKRDAPLPRLRAVGVLVDARGWLEAPAFRNVREVRFSLPSELGEEGDARREPRLFSPQNLRSGSRLKLQRMVLHSGWVDLSGWLDWLEHCEPELQLTAMEFSPTDWWIRFRGRREVVVWPGSQLNASFSEGPVREILSTAPRGFFRGLCLPDDVGWPTVRRLPCFERACVGPWPGA